MKLIKYSSPGWEIEVADEVEAARLLWPHICETCRTGEEFYEEDGTTLWFKDDPAIENDLDSMLSTACGLEYGMHYSKLEALTMLKNELDNIDRDTQTSLYVAYFNALNSGIFEEVFENEEEK